MTETHREREERVSERERECVCVLEDRGEQDKREKNSEFDGMAGRPPQYGMNQPGPGKTGVTKKHL